MRAHSNKLKQPAQPPRSFRLNKDSRDKHQTNRLHRYLTQRRNKIRDALTTIRNCYLSYFSGSYFNEESIRVSINHHGTLISHTLDFSDFHRVTNTIDHDHQNDYVILIEGQEGSDLVKYYRALRNSSIIWAGTDSPNQPANNIQRWCIPSHHLNRQKFKPKTKISGVIILDYQLIQLTVTKLKKIVWHWKTPSSGISKQMESVMDFDVTGRTFLVCKAGMSTECKTNQ